MNQNKIYSLFLPNKGCDNKCIYCNQYAATGKSSEKSDFKNQLLLLRKSLDRITEIGVYGSNFTALDFSEQENILKLISEITNNKIPLRISTRPDFITEDNVKLLSQYNVKTLELGLQTASEKILKILNRNYTLDRIVYSNGLLKKYNFILSYHIMFGLPEETENDFNNTIDFVISLKPEYVRIHPLIVIKDTELYQMYIRKEFQPLSFDDAIKKSAYAYKKFVKNNIKVIKIGLQSELSLMSNIVAGPYHPCFSQFVKSSIILDKIEKILKNNAVNFIIETNSKFSDFIRGYKNMNLDYLNNIGLKKILINNELNTCKLKLLNSDKEYLISI